MTTPFLLVVALHQQPAPPPVPALPQPPNPIARLVVTPGLVVTMTAQDTLRIVATAVDSAGKPVPNATVTYLGQGGRFEGSVDSTGLVRSGSTGTLTVTAAARVPGNRMVLERIEVRMVPGPVARIQVAPLEVAR